MIQTVYQSFKDNTHAMIEAGTGTGKSLGYLIPAAIHSLEDQKPVIISTQTIPLQDTIII